jgi:hypothetical protein
VDVIVDCVGAPYLEKDIDCLAMDGKVVFIGWMGGARPCLLLRAASITNTASTAWALAPCCAYDDALLRRMHRTPCMLSCIQCLSEEMLPYGRV